MAAPIPVVVFFCVLYIALGALPVLILEWQEDSASLLQVSASLNEVVSKGNTDSGGNDSFEDIGESNVEPNTTVAGAKKGNTTMEASFLSFISQYERQYVHGSPEFVERLEVFSRRVEEIKALNSRPNKRWVAGINALLDRTEAELSALRGWRGRGLDPVADGRSESLSQVAKVGYLPAECSKWSGLVAMQEIQSQGSCGSCWAVTASTVLSAHTQIYTGSTRTFSTQELVSCVPNPHSCGGNGGCSGATVELAFEYALKNGLSTAEQEPYQGVTGFCLNAGFGSTSFGMKSWEKLPENKYDPIMRAVYERGPVAVAVHGGGWPVYSGGIFDSCPLDAVIDHAVTLIGYGEAGDKFWLIQNSWGQGWGEGGKLRLLRSDSEEDHCGTDSQPLVGNGCVGGPPSVRVCGMCGILYDAVIPYF